MMVSSRSRPEINEIRRFHIVYLTTTNFLQTGHFLHMRLLLHKHVLISSD